ACMRRREFLGILGSAAAWPVALKAQQAEPVRRVGFLYILGPDDPEAQARITVFEQTLRQLGRAVGRNLVIDTRLVAGDTDRIRRNAAELVALAPDVITSGSLPLASLQQVSSCPYRKSNPSVLMVQSPKDRPRFDTPGVVNDPFEPAHPYLMRDAFGRRCSTPCNT